MRHDFPDKGNYPAFKRMETEGIRADRMTPVAQPNTFPGHVSLATGTTPDIHGIVDNVFYDREKGTYIYSSEADWINAEPLWVASERQGIKTATYFWVGSETDWRGQGTSYRMAPFDNDREESEKVDKIIERLDLPEADRPGLIMSYWRGADSVVHMKGPEHPDVAATIQEQDLELGRLIAALDERDRWSSTTLVIVSDHGMTEVSESFPLKQTFEEAGLEVRITGGSSGRHLFLESESDRVEVLGVLATLDHISIHQGQDVPLAMRAENCTGDIVLTTTPPYTFSGADSLFEKAVVAIGSILGWKHGAHGFDAQLEDMGAIFFAMGRGVTAGKPMKDIHQLDVAPTVTKLLGIEKPLMAIRDGVSLE